MNNEQNKAMKTFLESVAADMLQKYKSEMGHTAVVFPNKRAALFLNRAIARLSDGPVWSPAYITISELFRQHSTLTVADPILTIAILHESYTKITGSNEDLDRFFSWGQLLLSDFDDLDKNMGDARKIFRNVSDLHELDTLSYLDENEINILRRFFKNFTADDTLLKEKFLRLWSKMADIYTDFKDNLRRRGLAYEGMLYRDVVEGGEIPYLYERYLFVGFNVIQKVEQRLFSDLKSKGMARFYWDYDRYYMGSGNEAGVYIWQWLDKYPNELRNDDDSIYDNMLSGKKIDFVSAPTENLQARFISTWLRENDRYKDGSRTAIVMCDENLLQTVVHCIPPEVKELNVTTGYPLKQTPIASLVAQLISLQTRGWDDKHRAFRLHHVNSVLRHPYARHISPSAQEIYQEINKEKRFYLRPTDMAKDDGLAEVFSREGMTIDTTVRADGYDLTAMLRWLMAVVKRVAVNGIAHTAKHDIPLFQESCFRMYKLLNSLLTTIGTGNTSGTPEGDSTEPVSTIGDTISIYTFQHLMMQIINTTSIPFHGEPVKGVQVMGVLETRNLDFDHILILSCNEGNMPKGVDDSSFIPHAIRAAYGLTTVDNKVAVYSYYFHSMLQRASDVTIAYNTSTECTSSGEMSRFMLQLMVEMPKSQTIGKTALQAGQIPAPMIPEVVVKDDDVMTALNTIKKLSPTAINTYMRCGMQFFYKYVAQIRELDDQDEDEIDNKMFGNIFHRAAELLYERPRKDIDTILNIAFNEELFNLKTNTETEPQLNGIQLINRSVIKRYLMMLIELDKQLGDFKVIAHETDVAMRLKLNDRTITVGGRIDRLDRVDIGTPRERLRVVDYKTGTRTAGDITAVDDVFKPENITGKHTDYIFQAMLYSIIEAENDFTYNPNHDTVSPALLFIQRTKVKDYDPTITMNKQPITDISVHRDTFVRLLKEKLNELFNPDVPFGLSNDPRVCRVCPYRLMCGK